MKEALEAGMEVLERTAAKAADDTQRLVVAKCAGLLYGYHARWKDQSFVAIAVEQMLMSDLVNPATGSASRSFRAAGKLDVIAEQFRQRILIDHKTTSEDITRPDAPYWRQLGVEGQINQYFLLGWANGFKFDSALWDVTRKPTIRPKKLSKAERTSVTSTGMYFGWRLKPEDVEQIAWNTEEETLPMYTARLAHDCTVERRDWYFQRRAIPRVDHEIMEYAGELWQHSQDLLHTRRQTGLPPRNSGACMAYGTPCKFLGICSGNDSPESSNWVPKRQRHPELGDVGNGLQLLTNTRIRTFQTCRRKHHYEFEQPIERVNEEEKEALWFGSLYHEVLEAWWLCFKKPENEHGECSNSASADDAEHATPSEELSL